MARRKVTPIASSVNQEPATPDPAPATDPAPAAHATVAIPALAPDVVEGLREYLGTFGFAAPFDFADMTAMFDAVSAELVARGVNTEATRLLDVDIRQVEGNEIRCQLLRVGENDHLIQKFYRIQ